MAPRKTATGNVVQNATGYNAQMNAANAAAPKSKTKSNSPPKSRSKSRREPNTCRIDAYDSFRTECAKMGSDCALVKQCGKYGVGSDLWKVDEWMLKPEQIKVITPHNFKNGRHCMTKVMWADKALRDRLTQCNPGASEPAVLGFDPQEPIPFAVASKAKTQTKSGAKSPTKTKTKTLTKSKTRTL